MSQVSKKKNIISKISIWKFIINKIDRGNCSSIGSGAYGEVYKVIINGKYIAVKISDTYDATDLSACLSEGLRVASPLSSNLTQCLGVYIDEDKHDNMWRIYTAMEYCQGGDLGDFIESKHYVCEETVKVLMYSLLKGIADMNENGTMHRDLKPKNILLMRKGHIEKCDDVKIGDFGLCGNVKVANEKNLSHNIITRWYRPIEIELKLQYGVNIDVFSIGCIIVEFMTRKPLIQSSEDGMLHLKKVIEVLGPITPQCVNYMESIIRKDENRAISANPNSEESKYYRQKRVFWEDVKKFNATLKRKGNISKLKPLLEKIRVSSELKGLILRCLDTNPVIRPNAAALLTNSYFDSLKVEKKIEFGSPLNLVSPLSNICASPKSPLCRNGTYEMADFIRNFINILGYSNATIVLAFGVFRRYIKVVQLHKNNYRKIAIVIMNIVATYITDHDSRTVKIGTWLNQPKAGMNQKLFRKLWSETIETIIDNDILPATSHALAINSLSLNSVFILCFIIENEINIPLNRQVDIALKFGKFLERFPSYMEVVTKLFESNDGKMFEKYYYYFKRESEGIFSLVFSNLTISSVFESDNIMNVLLSYL